MSPQNKASRIFLETLKFSKKKYTFFEYLFLGTKIVQDPDYETANCPIQDNDLDFTIDDDFCEDIPEGKNQ